jgi:hypothetical protein
VIDAAMLAAAALSTVWTAGAIYYDLCRSARWGRWFALGWVAGVLVVFIVCEPTWQPFLVLAGVEAAFIAWWLRQKPRHDREWDPSVAVLPRVERQGETVTFENVRNFEYRSLDDFTPRYETRTVHISNLRGADLILFNWGLRWMSHPVLVFDFGPDGRICGSIEVRYRKGQGFSILRSLYRQQELIFLVADERDAILRRTKYGKPQTAHLYRLTATAEAVQRAFFDYIGAINDLYDRPRWYHGVCANCTTTFYRLPNSRRLYDWRILVNGRFDRALYEDGRLDTSVPFEELRRTARMNDIANAAPEVGFGDYLRSELERRRHE